MDTRLIEMYIGYMDNTWGTDYVEIPKDTPENKIEEVALAQANKDFAQVDAAFIGLYNITEMEEEDES